MGFAAEALETNTRAMERFVALLDEARPDAAEDFAAAVRHAIEDYGVSASAFVDEFGVSRGTVSRWANAKSVPHPMARPRVLSWIKDQLDEKLQGRPSLKRVASR